MITVVAMPLATSPALYPPMPSASTTRPLSPSEAIESSLWDLTIPGSVQLAISSAPDKVMMLKESQRLMSTPAPVAAAAAPPKVARNAAANSSPVW